MRMGALAADALGAGNTRADALETAARSAHGANLHGVMVAYGPSFGLAWAETGFATVEPSHRLAASLMATNIPQQHVGDFVRMPWRCFGFHIPAGLVEPEPAFALVLNSHDGGVYQMLSLWGLELHYGIQPSLGDWNLQVTGAQINDPTFAPQAADRFTRKLELVGRLFLGLCAEMTAHRPSLGSDSTHNSQRRDHRGVPIAFTFKLTRDVNVDARPAIREYVEGRRAKGPSVQVLVRGHWKSQACGPGLTERKIPLCQRSCRLDLMNRPGGESGTEQWSTQRT